MLCCYSFILAVGASHSQRDGSCSSFSRNSQCTCSILVFLVYLNELSRGLDRVLQQGEGLYTAANQQLHIEGKFGSNHLNAEKITLIFRGCMGEGGGCHWHSPEPRVTAYLCYLLLLPIIFQKIAARFCLIQYCITVVLKVDSKD